MTKDKKHEKKEEHKKEKYEKKELTKEEQITELTDKYMRALAEVDNTRKRTIKEKEDYIKYAKREAVEIFLPVLDNLDRAVHATTVTDNIEGMKKGIEMVIKQFDDVLKDMGAKEIHTKGVFDPDVHHVIHKEHVDGKKEGEILEVYQKGYTIDGITIRPARVKVAVKDREEGTGKREQEDKDKQETGKREQEDKEEQE